MNDWLGGTLGNYRIEAALGVGGMGRVFRAVHIHINRVAAIKVLHEQFAVDPAFQARFLREAQAVAALHHPNIVDIYDFNEDKGVFYLVMEYVPDGSLRTLLKDHADAGRSLPLTTGLELIVQAADALGYAHQNGMVHRDIKPDNLLLKRDPLTGEITIKVADFGLARLGDSARLTVEGQAMGTPAYMSPEQCQGIDLDGRSDIYSLGVVLYEVATGTVPFVMKSLTDAIYKHVYVAPPPPRSVRPDLPEALSAIIMRCLAKEPAERFATAEELAAALKRLPPVDIRDARFATTIAEQITPVEQLRVVLDSGDVPLTPGQVASMTVTIVNLSEAPVHASISIDGVPEEWISTPPRDVQIAPGGEVSGPLRVAVPVEASVGPSAFPVVVRAEVRENPHLRAEATTRLLIQPGQGGSGAVALPSDGGRGQPPARGATSDPARWPAWLPIAAGALLLLMVAGVAWTLLGADDPDDDDDVVIVSEGTATLDSNGNATTAATDVATEATEQVAEATVTQIVVVDSDETPEAETPTVEVATATSTPRLEAEAIIFTAGRNFDDPAGSLEIYIMNPDGSDQRPLITGPDDDWLSAISPDGTQIVRTSRRHGNHQLYLSNVDNSGERRLTTSSGDDLHAFWSPDAQRILFIRNDDGDDEVYVIDVASGDVLMRTDNDAYDGFALWSPDGALISWTSGVDGNNEIYVQDMTTDGSSPVRLTNNPANDFNSVWSPDGTQIAFVSNRGGDNDIWRMLADGSQLVQLTTDAADEFAPAWSPDGSRVAFCRQNGSACDVVIMNTDGSGERVLAENGSPNDPDITWSPDSSHVAYLSEDAGNYDIWTVAIEGGDPQRLTDAPGNDANVIWYAPQ